jgi:hypothetical protein
MLRMSGYVCNFKTSVFKLNRNSFQYDLLVDRNTHLRRAAPDWEEKPFYVVFKGPVRSGYWVLRDLTETETG